jgi:hypothetical protein
VRVEGRFLLDSKEDALKGRAKTSEAVYAEVEVAAY